jgi:glycosyltransferase involved in cell wall biosynthesis
MFKENSFSVIIPSHNRSHLIGDAIQSVINQTYKNWEIVVVDDCSTDNTEEVVMRIAHTEEFEQKIKYVKHDKNKERVASVNTGHAHAKGDYVCWLDSDDVYLPIYLDTFNKAINQYPEYPIFNCGKLVFHYTKIKTDNFGLKEEKFYDRYGLMPAFKFTDEGDHEADFPTGKLGSGQFVFKRELLAKALPDGKMPEASNCYTFADIAGIPGYDSKTRTLGNPWGQDFFMIYKLTRIAKSKPIDVPLYIHLIR